jgi:hypothetical protein
VATVLIFATMLLLCSTLGNLVVAALGLSASEYRMPLAMLSGITALGLLGQWCAYLNLPTTFLASLVIALILASGALEFRKNRRNFLTAPIKIWEKIGQLEFIGPSAAALVLMLLSQKGWSNVRFTYRIGPDFFGWSDITNFFRDGKNLMQLTSTVQKQLGNTPIYEALKPYPAHGMLGIHYIASFMSQIDAEFLLGAHRTGIPYFLGTFAHLLPNSVTESVLIAFMMVISFTLAQIIVIRSKKINVPKPYLILGTFAIPLGSNLLSQTLEGGFGQFYAAAFAFFLVVIIIDETTEYPLVATALGLLVLVALTSYCDVLFSMLPIVCVLLIHRQVSHENSLLKTSLRNWRFWSLCLAAIPPIFSSIFRLFVSPFLYPQAGGWDQGRWPFPTDLFGITSYLGRAGVKSHGRSAALICFEVLLNIFIICYVFLKAKGKERALLVTLLAIYSYLMLSTYVGQSLPNNYRLWKFSGYASPLFMLILLHRVSAQGKKLARTKQIISFSTTGLILMSIATVSFLWISDWQSSKLYSLSAKDIQYVSTHAGRYGFVFGPGTYPAEFTLYGDIYAYDEKRRIYGPDRPIIYLTARTNNCSPYSLACFSGSEELTNGKLKLEKTYIGDSIIARETAYAN